MGLRAVASGQDHFDGRDLTQLAPYERARAGIGYVPQGREIFPRLTVAENLRDGPCRRGRAARDMPGAIFEMFPVLEADAAPARRRPFRAASSSSSPSAARSPWGRGC